MTARAGRRTAGATTTINHRFMTNFPLSRRLRF